MSAYSYAIQRLAKRGIRVQDTGVHATVSALAAEGLLKAEPVRRKGAALLRSADPTREQLRSLHWLAWSNNAIAEAAGVSRWTVSMLLRDPERRVRADIAEAIDAVFIAARDGDIVSPEFARVATRTINKARKNGWPRPEDVLPLRSEVK